MTSQNTVLKKKIHIQGQGKGQGIYRQWCKGVPSPLKRLEGKPAVVSWVGELDVATTMSQTWLGWMSLSLFISRVSYSLSKTLPNNVWKK